MPNIEDSLLMLEHLLNFLLEPEQAIEHKCVSLFRDLVPSGSSAPRYWFGLFREFYLSVLYPEVVVAENKATAPGPGESALLYRQLHT